jgi:hypothetical protein
MKTKLAVMTITNVSAATVSVRLVWIDQETCTPEDQWIELTGGQHFWQQADVLVYNNNEQAFSSTVYFPCWDSGILPPHLYTMILASTVS